MAIRSVPSIDQLIQANRQINRSLRVYTSKRRKSLFYFCDPEGKEVKAVPVQFPQIITAENVHDPLNLHKGQSSFKFKERPFFIRVYGDPDGPSFEAYLTRDEVNLVLGKDSEYDANIARLYAMLNVASGGPVIANAYVLSGESGVRLNYNWLTAFAVQYYRINPEKHKEWGIESDKELLERRVREIEIDRERKIPASQMQ